MGDAEAGTLTLAREGVEVPPAPAFASLPSPLFPIVGCASTLGSVAQMRLLPEPAKLVLQAVFEASSVAFVTLAGDELCRVDAASDTPLAEVQMRLRDALPDQRFDVISPNGILLERVLAEDGNATLEEFLR